MRYTTQSSLLSLSIIAALAVSAPALAVNAAALKAQTNAGVAQRAQSLINGTAGTMVHRASADSFAARTASVDARGKEHVRFARTYRGLPVIGGDFIVHSKGGKVVSVSQTLRTNSRPNITPAIAASRVIASARSATQATIAGTPSSRLVVYALGSHRSSPVLAYEVRVQGVRKDQTPTDMVYYFNAANGAKLAAWDNVETAQPGPDPVCSGAAPTTGTGKSLLLGNIPLSTAKCGKAFKLLDPTRGNGTTTNMANRTTGMGTVYTNTTNVWGNGTNKDAASAGADAHFGVETTWDYYKNEHGRNGIADDGQGAVSRVHYGRNYSNAFWSDGCFCMTFGDGDPATDNPLVFLDIAGHEMSHGVTSRSAALAYAGDAGGLNESTSDIFGTMVEYYANNAADPGDYMIGENLAKNNPDGTIALRYMFKPSLDGASPDCWDSSIANLDPHYSSGVGNHFYYLLAEGSVVPDKFGAGTWANLTPADLVCAGPSNLVGIGREEAANIWYTTLTEYLTEDSTYPDARAGSLQAAADLYGEGSTEYNAVAAAWDAVTVPAAAP